MTRSVIEEILCLLVESHMKAVSRGLQESDPEVHEPVEAAIKILEDERVKMKRQRKHGRLKG